MRYLLIGGLSIILLGSCQAPEKKVLERPGEPDIVYAERDDYKMNEAIQKAQDTWDHFLQILREGKYDEGVASVKLKFPTSDGNNEHIWATDLHMIDNDLYAVIDNVPEKIDGLSMGDTVLVPKYKVSDWLYGDQGVLKGGYTIRVIRDNMTPQKRKQFDKEFFLIIQDE